jgi:hypothetical protein
MARSAPALAALYADRVTAAAHAFANGGGAGGRPDLMARVEQAGEDVTAARAHLAALNPYGRGTPFTVIGDFLTAEHDRDARARLELYAAWSDVTSPDVPGIIAGGRAPLPDLSAEWVGAPFLALVARPLDDVALGHSFEVPGLDLKRAGRQATEKTEIDSQRIQVDQITVPWSTIALGADVALQVLARAPQPYLQLFQDLFRASVNAGAEAEVMAQLRAAATPVIPADSTNLADAVADALAAVDAALSVGTADLLVANPNPGRQLQLALGQAAAAGYPPVVVSNGVAPGSVLALNGAAVLVGVSRLGFMWQNVPSKAGTDLAAYRLAATAVLAPGAVAAVTVAP